MKARSEDFGYGVEEQMAELKVLERLFDCKYSEQHLNVPPSYEEAVNGAPSPTYSERDGEPSQASAPKASHPPSSASPSNPTAAAASPPQPLTSSSAPAPAPAPAPDPDNKKVDGFDEFDPRGLAAPTMPNVAAPTTSGGTEMDLLDSLALVPVTQITTSEADASVNSSHGPANSATPSQPFDDPFGDGPFKVTSTNSVPAQQPIITSTSSFHPSSSQNSGPPQPIPQNTTTEFGGKQSPQQEMSTLNQDFDVLADILPPSGASLPVNLQTGYPVPVSQPALQSGFASQPGQPSLQTSYPLQPGQSVPMAPTFPALAGQASQTGFPTQSGQPTSLAGFPSQMGSSQAVIKTPDIGQSAGSNTNFYGGQFSNAHGSQSVLPASTMSTAIVPQPSKAKFETKSTVWADTLSRGLVDLNISGTKTNPLADIGVDFEAINRKERRMEKPTASTATSNVTMGKAMGSGSGIGRAGAGSLRHPSNPVMGSGMGIGTTGQPRVGIGMGGYGVNPQPMGNMGMGMNMGMGQGVNMQQQTGFPPVTRPGGYNYNPMTGTGNFNQQPYGGGY